MDVELLAARYRVLRTLGEGGMGVVYLVADTRKDDRILALKILKASEDVDALEKFKSEFRNIRGVAHPNIPEVFDFGVLPERDSSPYFTTEFVEGSRLDSLRDAWTAGQLHEILISLCRALAFLHSRSLLHRDIKPENVLGKIDDSGKFSLLKLLDFGLSGSKEHQSTETSGTIDFMAPEIVEGNAATVSTDLYAVGILLYRLATGRMPFAGDDTLAVMKQRCTTEAPPPLRYNSSLPVGLSDVISALIRINPEERPASARHVIALLNEHEGTDYLYESRETQNAYIRSAASVTHHVTQLCLSQEKDRFIRGEHPSNRLILAPRGLGRTRLIREFASELTLSDCAPKLIQSNLDLTARNLENAQILLVPSVEHVDKQLLLQIIAETCPASCWIILGTEHADNALVSSDRRFIITRLKPLNLKAIHEFVTSTFPENTFPEEFDKRMETDTLGFPIAIQSVFDMLLESELLRIGLAGWELVPGQWSIPAHPAVVQYIEERCVQFTAQSRRLLHTVACAASPISLEIMSSVLGWDADLIRQATQPLIDVGWLQPHADTFFLQHSVVARLIWERMDEIERREIHASLKRTLQTMAAKSTPCCAHEILYHDFKSLEFSIPATQARDVLNDVIEKGNLQWARSLLTDSLAENPPKDYRWVIVDALSQIESIEGNLERSAALLAELLDSGSAEANNQNLDLLARYAGILEKLGQTDAAEAILKRCREVLTSESNPQVGNILGPLAWIAFKRGEQEKARDLAEEGLAHVSPGSTDSGHALLLHTVATLNFYLGDVDSAALAWQRCLEVYEAIHDRKGIANMYNNLGVLAAQSGDRLRARSLWEKCADIAREINDVHRLAGIYNNLGIDSLETGNLQEAEENYLKALTLFRRIKNPREQVEILSNLGELSYYRADYARAQAYLAEALSLADALGDHESQIEPLVYFGKLLLTLEELEHADDVLHKAQLLANQTGAKKGEGQAWENLAILYTRRESLPEIEEALSKAHELLGDDNDPLAHLNFHLTETAVASELHRPEKASSALIEARKVADTKWDPYTASRTLVYGLLFAQEQSDGKARVRTLRQLSVYPELLWKYHWAIGRSLTAAGVLKKALDEYGRGVTVLKAISSRLSEKIRDRYLSSPQILRFKAEAITLRKSLESEKSKNI